jgi:hypothetical protein
MTDEPREETQPEEQEDVEGHGGLPEPHFEPERKHGDEDDDVEGHSGLGQPHFEPPIN